MMPFESIVAAFLVAFGADYLANLISFKNRVVSALVTATITALALGIFLFVTSGTPDLPLTAAAFAIMFVIALIGNMLNFSNRLTNAVITGLVFLAALLIFVFTLLQAFKGGAG